MAIEPNTTITKRTAKAKIAHAILLFAFSDSRRFRPLVGTMMIISS
jgi:hypothetical protein